jgi:hypothetical protein
MQGRFSASSRVLELDRQPQLSSAQQGSVELTGAGDALGPGLQDPIGSCSAIDKL